MVAEVHAFIISNTFKSNAKLKLATKKKKNQKLSNTQRQKKSLVENYSVSLSTLTSKKNEDILKNVQKTSASVLMALYD